MSQPQPPSSTVELFDWLKAELRDWWLGSSSTKSSAPLAPADITVRRSGLVIGDAGPCVTIDQALEAFRAQQMSSRKRKRLHIHIAADRFVLRKLADGRIPLSRSFRMAELDVSANTPFAPEDVHVLFPDNGDRTITEYALVRRDIIDPVFEAMNATRCGLGLITLERNGNSQPIHSSAIQHFRGNARGVLPWLKRRLFIVVSCLALSVLIWNFFSSIERATAGVDGTIESAEPAANKARETFKKHSDYVARLRLFQAEQAQYVPAARILDELTRIIPDDTFLTDFTLQKDKILISGLSKSAAGLIAILDASPLFAKPRFTSAVVNVQDQKSEQFSMELEIEHAG